MGAFFGMRGTGNWVANQRPENWRESILYLYPNGSAPLTAILSMLSSEETNDPVFHWWTKSLPDQGGSISDLYTDAALGSALSAVTVNAETVIYAKVAEAVADHFRAGHQARLTKTSDVVNYTYIGKVVDVFKNGDNSHIAVRLLENTNPTYPLESTSVIDVAGNMNPEGATMPSPIAYDPTEYYNYTQIFRTPLSITRTARKTRLRTGDAYAEAKREALELHAIEMEIAFIDSVRYSGTGANGKPERATYGLRQFILDNAPSDNISNYTTSAGFGSKAWTDVDGGMKWLNEKLEIAFRHGRQEKLGLCGNHVLLGINRLAETHGTLNISVGQGAYGIKVMEWMTPFGTIYLKTHPLFNRSAAYRNHLMLLEPENLRYRYIDDTFFVEDPQDRKNRNNSRDGTEEEFITEAGLEIHHPSTMAYLTGFNTDATTSA